MRVDYVDPCLSWANLLYVIMVVASEKLLTSFSEAGYGMAKMNV
jgi:hypothetical protein